jgi:hypothetical protein
MNSLLEDLIRRMKTKTRRRVTKPVQDHTNGILLLNLGKIISFMSDIVQLGIQLLVGITEISEFLFKLMNMALLGKKRRGLVDLHY